MGVTVLGIIMVPLGMAIALGFRATVSTQQRLASAQDAQAVSAYFPADVQSVDPTGFNPTDSVNENVCPANPSDPREEFPLALFVWNQDLGVNGQTVVRYIARGKGKDSELVRRYCETTIDRAGGRGPRAATSARADDRRQGLLHRPRCGEPGPQRDARVREPHAARSSSTTASTTLFKLTANRRVAGTSEQRHRPRRSRPTSHTTGGNHACHDLLGHADRRRRCADRVVLHPEQGDPGDHGSVHDARRQSARAGEPGAVGVVITGLTNGQGYTFRVRAKNVLGAGRVLRAVVRRHPGPDRARSADDRRGDGDPTVAGKASATWSLPAGYNNGGNAAHRLPHLRAEPAEPGVDLRPVRRLDAERPTATGLSGNTHYTLQVAALNANGEGSPSASSNQILTLPGQAGHADCDYAAPRNGQLHLHPAVRWRLRRPHELPRARRRLEHLHDGRRGHGVPERVRGHLPDHRDGPHDGPDRQGPGPERDRLGRRVRRRRPRSTSPRPSSR